MKKSLCFPGFCKGFKCSVILLDMTRKTGTLLLKTFFSNKTQRKEEKSEYQCLIYLENDCTKVLVCWMQIGEQHLSPLCPKDAPKITDHIRYLLQPGFYNTKKIYGVEKSQQRILWFWAQLSGH